MALTDSGLHNEISYHVKQLIYHERCFFCLVTSTGQWNNSEFPWGIEPQTFRFALQCSTTEHRDSTLSEVYYEVKWHATCILLGSAMSIVKWNVFSDRNSRDGKFWAWQRIKKDVFSSCHKHGTKKKFWVSMRGRFLLLNGF